ncbi:xylose isomerase [Paraburkholderia caffeinilytica]|uniref:Xylose isomerase n=1 Tax=Paraburkholderia caffeinilytica TaxID=1761016 RepID=A0ABQ1MMJ2_9BURK|nr:xylose isomerase [Paraburkholderia caffeinilytica]GGC43101.1 xylose isomerase [Paraburkholderia caffeinilytica]CAB3790603.1 Xylose isomerase [Paraburkholderia caffeinilytica]
MSYFEHIPEIRYEGPQSDNPLAYRHYDKRKQVLGKTLEEHLRIAVCYWHTFVWPGVDIFGQGTFRRPWQQAGDAMERAHQKADSAFEFFSKLGTPYYTFHDTDVAPEGDSLKAYSENFTRIADYLARKQQDTGIKLLWGTANLFSHPRYAAGAATSPDPEVFAFAATQVRHALDATQRLGGENYVLWGGREGYDTLLNTDLVRERDQLARFLHMVVEHKHKIGFKGALLIEPKPQEPTKHQYDYDVATVHGFLLQYGLEKEIRVNIEANHATLAGHSFHHEIATAYALGIFGSVDANRGDQQNGWDTDQFPNSVEELTLAFYEILKHGGFTTGGMNFDAKVRRQSVDAEDLFFGHIGAIDNLALAVERAATLIENDRLEQFKRQRYAGWESEFGRKILKGDYSLSTLAADALTRGLNPQHVSGRQEQLENVVNQAIYSRR